MENQTHKTSIADIILDDEFIQIQHQKQKKQLLNRFSTTWLISNIIELFTDTRLKTIDAFLSNTAQNILTPPTSNNDQRSTLNYWENLINLFSWETIFFHPNENTPPQK